MSSKDSHQLKLAMIATIPKSGTMRCSAFFYVLSNLLRGNNDATAIGTPPGGRIEIPELGARFVIGHSMYPGLENLDQQQLKDWQEIPFSDESYNSAYWAFRQTFARRQEKDMPPPKILHIYRNPLDQAISIYHNKIAIQQNREQGTLIDDLGHRWDLEFSGLFRGMFLPLWVKLHYPFLLASERWPRRVMMLTFEDLMAEPVKCFEAILRFFRVNLDDSLREILKEAVKRTEKEEIQRIESTHRQSLWDIEQKFYESTTPLVEDWRHVRDGSSGQWKSKVSEGDFEFAKNYLRNFGLDLEELLAGSVQGQTSPTSD